MRYADRRQEVIQSLLPSVTDLKALHGGTREAQEKAERAWDLAKEEPPLAAPWFQLAAYRLAHLLMRDERRTLDALLRVSELFEAASSEPGQKAWLELGRLPVLYRLSVLHQIVSAPKNEELTRWKRELDKIFERAVDQTLDWNRHQESQATQQLQSNSFNMLELATYFLGRPARRLEGACMNMFVPKLSSGQGWYILCNALDLTQIRIPRRTANVELADLGRKHQGSLLIRFPKPAKGNAEWQVAGRHDHWKPVNQELAELIVRLLLSSSPLCPRELSNQIIRGDEPKHLANLRQMIHRGNKNANKLFGDTSFDLILSDGDQSRMLNLDKPIFAAYQEGALRFT